MDVNLRAVIETEMVRGVRRHVFAVVDITRCYPLYGFLCGVRSEETGCELVVRIRGLPPDVEDETVD